MLTPGSPLAAEFTLRSPTTGAAADADSLPVAFLVRNGDDTGVSITVTHKATGVYKAAGDIPSGYAAGDLLQLRVTATVSSVTDNYDVWNALLDGASESTGGSNLVTVTVKDEDDDPIQGVKVRFRSGLITGALLTTDSNGVATDSLDDGTYTLTATKLLYSGSPQTVTVNGDEDFNVTLTGTTLPAADGDNQTTAWLYTYDGNGEIAPHATITFKVINSDGSAGRGIDGTRVYATSDGTGLLTISLLKNTHYSAVYHHGHEEFTTGDDPEFPIPEIVGK